MNRDELRSYSMLLTKDVTVRDEVVTRLNNFMALDEAALHGAKTEAEMLANAHVLLKLDAPTR